MESVEKFADKDPRIAKEPTVLFLGPCALGESVDAAARSWQNKLEDMLGKKIKFVVADFPYELESGAGCKGYWTKPTYPTAEGRRKLLRKQLNCSMVMMLTEVIRHQPQLIVGLGQGGLVAALGSLPLAMEAACRARVLTDQQMCTIRKSWSKVTGIISVDPMIMPLNTSHASLLEAMPEISWLQPRGIFRAMFSEENNYSKRDFCAELAANMGTICRPMRELAYISGELLADMARPTPLVPYATNAGCLGGARIVAFYCTIHVQLPNYLVEPCLARDVSMREKARLLVISASRVRTSGRVAIETNQLMGYVAGTRSSKCVKCTRSHQPLTARQLESLACSEPHSPVTLAVH